MIEKIFIFILFLGPLIFFHELGHFLFARLFGVRVEVFSIGFGPKMFKFKWGDTQWAVSLIPLGGYVKMYGDDPFNKDSVPAEERKFSFTHKGKWARFWIVMGGPLANFIMAYFLFFSLLMTGEHIPEMRIGLVPSDSVLYERGLRPGDGLRAVNGREITNPSDIVIEGQGNIETITVKRSGERVDIALGMNGEAFFEEFTKYPPLLRRPIVVNRAGEMFGVSFDRSQINWSESLDSMAHYAETRTLYFFEMDAQTAQDPIPDYFPEPVDQMVLELQDRENFINDLAVKGYLTLDLQVREVAAKSAAFDAGITRGDIIVSFEGKEVYSFEELRSTLQVTDKEVVKVGVLREGERLEFDLKPQVQVHQGEEVKLIGVYSSGQYVGLEFIHTDPKGIFASSVTALTRTWETMVKTVEGFFRLMTGQISFKSIGGPIAIGQVASDSYNTSISYFFQLMALISINLGVINLFPIPILDGGHILFIILEAINGGPISRRKMEIAQQFGLSALLLLMVGAIFNDVSRFF